MHIVIPESDNEWECAVCDRKGAGVHFRADPSWEKAEAISPEFCSSFCYERYFKEELYK